MKTLLIAAVALFGLWTGQAQAELTMTYQGQLTDVDAHAVTGVRPMVFRLYRAAEGGEPAWTEHHVEVDVVSGVFTAVLGARTALPTEEADGPLYLGITVGEEAEFTPRMVVGGALRAQWAAVAAQALDVAGRDIHPRSVHAGGGEVIDVQGRWVGDPTGLVGPVGVGGAQGEAGQAGTQGQAGPAGAQGAQGAAGQVGARGPQGEGGPAGAQGPLGAEGPAGDVGSEGPAGPVGAVGPAGPGHRPFIGISASSVPCNEGVPTLHEACAATFAGGFACTTKNYLETASPSVVNTDAWVIASYSDPDARGIVEVFDDSGLRYEVFYGNCGGWSRDSPVYKHFVVQPGGGISLISGSASIDGELVPALHPVACCVQE